MNELGAAVVIEDDDDIRNLIEAILDQAGFEVHSAATGREGLPLVRQFDPTVVTLDVGLPGMDGFEVLRRLREFSNCYVIMLTARSDEADTLTGLQSGADDYLTKPFRPRELRARITAMLRRPRNTDQRKPHTTPPATPPSAVGRTLQHNGLTVNRHTRTVLLNGVELALTRSEFDILHEVMRAAGAVRTKAELVRVARGEREDSDSYISDADERAIEVHVGNIRRKLGEHAQSPRWLQTVRGVGYRLAPASRLRDSATEVASQ